MTKCQSRRSTKLENGFVRRRIPFYKLLARPRWAGCPIFCLCLLGTGVLKAQTPDPAPLHAPQPGIRPPLIPFPRFEDWRFLRDPAQRVERYDRLKFIPLNESERIYLTLGLENRTEFQYLNSSDWGAGPQDHSGYLLERFMPDADRKSVV